MIIQLESGRTKIQLMTALLYCSHAWPPYYSTSITKGRFLTLNEKYIITVMIYSADKVVQSIAPSSSY